jgi:hypothetical protein
MAYPTPWFEDLPLNWAREETRMAAELLIAAYPMSQDVLTLAQNAGLNLATLDQSATTVTALVRDILNKARLSNALAALITEVLSDQDKGAVHERLRRLTAGHEALRRPTTTTEHAPEALIEVREAPAQEGWSATQEPSVSLTTNETPQPRDLHPLDHIDRDDEQQMFRDLVTYASQARILTICDPGERGKSSLLKRLRFNCERKIEPPIPSCLLELDKLPQEEISPFGFASRVARGFTLRGEDPTTRFEKFNSLCDAFAEDSTPFDDGGRTVRSSGPRALAGAHAGTIFGGRNIGLQVEHAETVQLAVVRDFTEQQKQRCVEALFDDLRTICAASPMVLLLDGWENCNLDLRAWIVDEVLANHVLHPDAGRRPDKLAVVIAGRPYEPAAMQHGLRTDELVELADAATVLSISSLSPWNAEHIRRFMELNGYPEASEAEVASVREKFDKGVSFWKIQHLIDAFRLAASPS